MKEKEKLTKILKENPDPSKWSRWLRFIIQSLVILLSALTGDFIDFSSLIF